MKSIKEKAEEAERNTHPLFESFRESKGKPVSVYDQDDMISMFEQGANYVLDEIDYILMDKDLDCEEKCDELIVLVEQLKK